MLFTRRLQGSSRKLGDLQDPALDKDNLRRNITYILVIAWLILVIGKAFGLVTSAYETDALLIGSVGVAFGYLYGRTVKVEEIKEFAGSPRTLDISQRPDIH